jgi:hypothetical protein
MSDLEGRACPHCRHRGGSNIYNIHPLPSSGAGPPPTKGGEILGAGTTKIGYHGGVHDGSKYSPALEREQTSMAGAPCHLIAEDPMDDVPRGV